MLQVPGVSQKVIRPGVIEVGLEKVEPARCAPDGLFRVFKVDTETVEAVLNHE